MKLNVDSLEYGLKVFYEMKYEKRNVEFTEIPDVVENIEYLNGWLERTAQIDPIRIEMDELFRLEDLLKKYFRDEFLEFYDRRSIEEYLIDKRSGEFEFNVFIAMTRMDQKNSDFYKWLDQTFKQIQWLKDINRYEPNGASRLITNISFEEYKDKRMKLLLQEYFIDQLEYALARIHLNSHLGIFRMKELEPQEDKLTINQIALKYVYEGRQITRANCNEIAKQYGHKSGEKLFQQYNLFSSAANRKGVPHPCTPKKLQNKIDLIESVISLLPMDKRQRANDELSILRGIQEAEYQ